MSWRVRAVAWPCSQASWSTSTPSAKRSRARRPISAPWSSTAMRRAGAGVPRSGAWQPNQRRRGHWRPAMYFDLLSVVFMSVHRRAAALRGQRIRVGRPWRAAQRLDPGDLAAGLDDRHYPLPLRVIRLHQARVARARRARAVRERGRDRAVLDRDRAPAADEPAVPGGCGDPRPVLEEQVEEDVARALGHGGQLLIDLGVRLGHLFSLLSSGTVSTRAAGRASGRAPSPWWPGPGAALPGGRCARP